MTAADPQSTPAASRRVTQSAGIAVVALAWCAALVTLVSLDSNPVVLNPVQIRAASWIVEGHFESGKSTRFSVSRVLKGSLAGTSIELEPPFPHPLPNGELIVPLSHGTKPGVYTITHGELPNFAESAGNPTLPQPFRTSHVLPLVYPATSAIQGQLETLLPATPVVSSQGEPIESDQ